MRGPACLLRHDLEGDLLSLCLAFLPPPPPPPSFRGSESTSHPPRAVEIGVPVRAAGRKWAPSVFRGGESLRAGPGLWGTA